ncbi:MAG: hypothetical protein AAFN74_28080, partial [Myxococcota bacterium]
MVNRSKATGVSVDEGRLKRLLEVQTRLALISLFIFASACGGGRARRAGGAPPAVPTSTAASVPGAPGWVSGEMPDLYDASTHLMVVGRGATPEEAEADAQANMLAAVLGPEADRPFTTIPEGLQSFAFAPGTERYRTEERRVGKECRARGKGR